MLEFKRLTDFPKGTIYDILCDAYSYDARNKEIWDSNLVAPKNYESVGFRLYDRKMNDTKSTYTGDYLYYEIILE